MNLSPYAEQISGFKVWLQKAIMRRLQYKKIASAKKDINIFSMHLSWLYKQNWTGTIHVCLRQQGETYEEKTHN